MKTYRLGAERRWLFVALVAATLGAAPAARAASAEIRPPPVPLHLGAPRSLGLRAEPVCPHGPCQMLLLVRPNGTSPATGIVSYFFPDTLHLFYQLPDDSVASPPPTIAVIEAGDDPTAEADLNTYSQKTGLPDCTSTSTPQCFYKYDGSGIPYTPGSSPATYDNSNSDDRQDALETTLDLQAAHATCENCRLMLVETNFTGLTTPAEGLDHLAAEVAWAAHNGGPGNAGAAVISNSYAYGGPGFTMPAPTDPDYTDYAQPGHVIVASSGDTGYISGYPGYPETNPNVVSVGGTTVSANQDGTYGAEAVWNNETGASGSSCNQSYTAPAWQASDPNYPDEGCRSVKGKSPHFTVFNYRASADVAMDGDTDTGFQIYQSFDPNMQNFQVGGGTSLSAPLIAGVYGLAGGYPAVAPPGGCPSGTSCAGYAPYAAQGAAVSALHDITTGNNAWNGTTCSGLTICQAGPGLDGPTGVGTPIGLGAFGGPSRPDAATDAATQIGSGSMTLNATIDPESQSQTTAYFCWGRTGGQLSNCTDSAPVSGGSQAFSQDISGLSPGTAYQYRAFATGPGGLGLGGVATATTAPPSETLGVSIAGAGSGKVTGPQIVCPGACSASYPEGATVTLTATPASGSSFAGWTGACTGTGTCAVEMDSAEQVTATFTSNLNPARVRLIVATNGPGRVLGGGIDCPGSCTVTYARGSTVTLVAEPAAGSRFAGWTGACSGTGTCSLVMSADRSVGATFLAGSSPPPPALRTCRISQLRLSVARRRAAAGHRVWSLAFQNTSTARCSLQGFPSVQLMGRHGGTIKDGVHRTKGVPAPKLTLAPGQRAFFSLKFVAAGPCGSRSFTAYGLDVVAPGDLHALKLRRQFGVCNASVAGHPLVSPVRSALTPPAAVEASLASPLRVAMRLVAELIARL